MFGQLVLNDPKYFQLVLPRFLVAAPSLLFTAELGNPMGISWESDLK